MQNSRSLEQLLAARVRNDADLADLAQERIDVYVIDRLSAQGLKADELAFIIPRRTLTHRRQQHERLSTEESDRAIRLARIIAQANTAFGSAEKAMRWLRNPQTRFTGRNALEMASLLASGDLVRVLQDVETAPLDIFLVHSKRIGPSAKLLRDFLLATARDDH